MALGAELKRLRRERGISSQAKLARLAGVSPATIKKAESGENVPKPDTLMQIARGFAGQSGSEIDLREVDMLYRELMTAAGHWHEGMLNEPEGEREYTRAELQTFLIRLTGRRDMSWAFSDIFWNYDRFSEAHRRLLEATALAVIEAEKTNEGDSRT